jgi:hypothetical protein
VAIQAHLADLESFIKRALPRDDRDAELIRTAQARARVILKELRKSHASNPTKAARRK